MYRQQNRKRKFYPSVGNSASTTASGNGSASTSSTSTMAKQFRGGGRGGRGGFGGGGGGQRRRLEIGMRGFLITCATKAESKCVREIYNLLNDYVDRSSSSSKIIIDSQKLSSTNPKDSQKSSSTKPKPTTKPEIEESSADRSIYRDEANLSTLSLPDIDDNSEDSSTKPKSTTTTGLDSTNSGEEEILDSGRVGLNSSVEKSIQSSSEASSLLPDSSPTKISLATSSKSPAKSPIKSPSKSSIKIGIPDEPPTGGPSDDSDPAADETNEESDDEDEDLMDVEKALKRECDELAGRSSTATDSQDGEQRSIVKKPAFRFASVDSGVNNNIFVSINDIDGEDKLDPCEIVRGILMEIKDTGICASRFIQRMLPVEFTCKAYVEDIEKAFQSHQDVLIKNFSPPPPPIVKSEDASAIDIAQPPTYAIYYKARNNDHMNRDDVIRVVGDLVRATNPLAKVDLERPQKAILIDILRTTACVSIVDDYMELSKFNLHSIADEKMKKEEMAKESMGSSVVKKEEEASTMSKRKNNGRNEQWKLERSRYLTQLVDEFRSTKTRESKRQVLANLANFAYDPINFDTLQQLGVIDLFLNLLDGRDEEFKEFAMGGMANLASDRAQCKVIADRGLDKIIECLKSPNVETVVSALTILIFVSDGRIQKEPRLITISPLSTPLCYALAFFGIAQSYR